MTTEQQWVLDATMGIRDGMAVFCPVDGDIEGDEFSVITGLSVISDRPPNGRMVAVIHEGGQEAVEHFCEEHAEFLHKLSTPDTEDAR